ncbi:hypothetical protein [Georgenia sp. Marseille-Q6866]
MSETTHDSAPPGRPVRLVPTPPGFWRLVLGLCAATFAPLFGFLLGSVLGTSGTGTELSPQYLGLFTGFVLGGLGLAVAFLGGRRLWFHYRRHGTETGAS